MSEQTSNKVTLFKSHRTDLNIYVRGFKDHPVVFIRQRYCTDNKALEAKLTEMTKDKAYGMYIDINEPTVEYTPAPSAKMQHKLAKSAKAFKPKPPVNQLTPAAPIGITAPTIPSAPVADGTMTSKQTTAGAPKFSNNEAIGALKGRLIAGASTGVTKPESETKA